MSTDNDFGSSGLDCVRRQGVFLLSAVMWAAAAGMLLIASAYLVFLVNQAIALIERFRAAAGVHAAASGPDWLLIGLLLFVAAVPAGALLLLWRWYRRHWNRRLDLVWGQSEDKRRFAKVAPAAACATAGERCERMRYVRALLSTPWWTSRWQDIRRGGTVPADCEAVALEPGQYETVSAEMLKAIEKSVTERAIATGLIVGVSSNPRLDALTILLAALEIQMHVLTELGKKPGVRLWIQLLKRCGASLFFNTYLNRGECLSVSFAIKQAGIGVQTVSELLDEGADLANDVDMDELSDMLGDSAPDYVKLALWAGATVSGVGLGAGGVALRIVGQAIEQIGDDLLQGVLAGAILYSHGMAIAADCLALDQQHRSSPEMTRTVKDGLKSVTAVAAGILRDQVRSRTRAYRQRRRQAVTQAPKLLGGRIWNSLKSGIWNRAKDTATAGNT